MMRAGFFTEIAHSDPGARSVTDVVDTGGEDQSLIARYLRDGYPVVHIPDAVMDPLGSGLVAGTSTVYTDGVWIWPHALAYFVAEHGVGVPSELANRARAHGGAVPPMSEEAVAEVGEQLVADGGWVIADPGEDPFAEPGGDE